MPQPASNSQRHKAASAIARGESSRKAAELAKVDRKTIARWQKQPDFAALVDKFQAGYVGRATGRLARAAVKAVATLLRLTANPNGQTALGAARAILEHCRNFREAGVLEKRLAEIEQKLGIVPSTKGAAA